MEASAPSSLVRYAHLSSVPAVPTTRQPTILPIWTTRDPVAPAAPETTSVSPGLGLPIILSPYQPVKPGIPSTPRYAARGSDGSTGLSPSPLDTKYSRQPSMLLTTAPSLSEGCLDSTMRPMARPSIGLPTSKEGA